MSIKRKFLSSTVGMNIFHYKTGTKLVRFHFYEEGDEVVVFAKSGYDLSTYRRIKSVTISRAQYDKRSFDQCNDLVEYEWAANLMGFYMGNSGEDWNEYRIINNF